MKSSKITILVMLGLGLVMQAIAQDQGFMPFDEPPPFRRGGRNWGDGENFSPMPRGDFRQFAPEFQQNQNMPMGENQALGTLEEMQEEMSEVEMDNGFVGQGRRSRVPRVMTSLNNKSPEELLIDALISRNPFGGSDKQEKNKTGIVFQSAIKLDGAWQFGISLKDGCSMYLGLNEENEFLPCKIIDFDEEAMLIKISAGGREEVLPIVQAQQGGGRRVELVSQLMPRDRPPSPEERKQIWTNFATDEERSAANNIFNAAKAEGRRMNRNDFRRLREIETRIQTRRNQQQQQGQGGGFPRNR